MSDANDFDSNSPEAGIPNDREAILAASLARTNKRLAYEAKRRKIAVGVLFVFVAVGFIVFKAPTQTETRVVFVLPPSVVIQGERVMRDRFLELSAEILDDKGRALSTTSQAFPGGARSPMTQPIRIQLPEARYQVRARIRDRDGNWGVCTGVLETKDGSTDARVRLK
jgi:hypothetical protein